MALFDQIYAVDPNNSENVAENGVISIFIPETRTLIAITRPTGESLPNPLQLNKRGFGPAFAADGFTEVAWEAVTPGEVFNGTFKSYKGILEVVEAAKVAAQSAAVTAGSDAVAIVEQKLAEGDFKGEPGMDGSNVVPTDLVVQQGIVRASGVTVAPVKAEVSGNLWVFDGDSITERPVGGAGGPTFANYAAITSKQRIKLVKITAVSGSKIEDMLARFDATIPPLKPSGVHLIAGTNNANDANQTPVAEFMDRIREYVAKVRALGAKVVIGTIPPNITSTARHALTLTYNSALRSYCAAEGIDMVDYYSLLVDPATGGIKTAFNADGTHPTNLGNVRMGELCAATLTPILPRVDLHLPQNNSDPHNLIANGLFLTTTGTTAGAGGDINPTSWLRVPSSRNAAVTGVLVTGDTSIIGNWWRLIGSAATGGELFYQNIPAAKVIPGNRYALRSRVKATGLKNSDTGAGASLLLRALFNNQNGIAGYDFRALSNITYDVADGVANVEFTAPADATSLQVSGSIGVTTSASFDTRVAQIALYNLTAQGLA